jgi:hypothetical protein
MAKKAQHDRSIDRLKSVSGLRGYPGLRRGTEPGKKFRRSEGLNPYTQTHNRVHIGDLDSICDGARATDPG